MLPTLPVVSVSLSLFIKARLRPLFSSIAARCNFIYLPCSAFNAPHSMLPSLPLSSPIIGLPSRNLQIHLLLSNSLHRELFSESCWSVRRIASCVLILSPHTCREGGMASAMSVALLVVAVLAMARQAAAGAVYEVGNGGWTIPATQNFFNTWAGGRTYYVGDVLQFNYNPEMHNVVKVGSIQDYHSCTMSSLLGEPFTDGATMVTLDHPGLHFFICSIPGHCADGMKLVIRAVNRPKV